MEDQSLSALAFKGSIAEAIAEAKQQKKLFVVYIAGDNAESKNLDTSTWSHPSVSETLAKYCILLHVLEGSSEASNFSAILESKEFCSLASYADPQNSVPCITAIGYNGVRLWQKEGFVAADVLASSLEKAWLSLHVQETTAAFLTAALASKNQSASGTSETASPVQEPPRAHVPSSLIDNHSPSSVNTEQSFLCETEEERSIHKVAAEEGDSKTFHKPSHASMLDMDKLDESSSKTKTGNASSAPVKKSQNNQEVASGKNLESSDQNLCNSKGFSQGVTNEASDMAQSNTDGTTEFREADVSDLSATKSSDVFVNIRLPDGISLQVKFLVTDTLRMVKDYIVDNQTSSLGSFDLAIPYPRKVFTSQDLDSTLSELGLFNRQALVVVPHKQTTSHYGGGSSTYQQTYSSDHVGSASGGEGYWAYVRRILSYANPLSYYSWIAGSSNSAQESPSDTWQNSANPSLRSNPRDAARPSTNPLSEQNTRPESGSRRRQPASRFGGNIHTLKHDEDDDRFNNRNTFWNGNSTQFGGDNEGK